MVGLDRRSFLFGLGAAPIMARLTPDPLQVDPFTNPIRIKVAKIRYVALVHDVRRRSFAELPIQVGTNCGGRLLSGGAGSYVSHHPRLEFEYDQLTPRDEPRLYVRTAEIGEDETITDATEKWLEPDDSYAVEGFRSPDLSPMTVSAQQMKEWNFAMGMCGTGIDLFPGGGRSIPLAQGIEPLTFTSFHDTFNRDRPIYRNRDITRVFVEHAYNIPSDEIWFSDGGLSQGQVCCDDDNALAFKLKFEGGTFPNRVETIDAGALANVPQTVNLKDTEKTDENGDPLELGEFTYFGYGGSVFSIYYIYKRTELLEENNGGS